MKKLTVVQVKVGENPEVISIENTLEEVQRLVGGYMEVVYLTNDLLLIVNEEGMIIDLPVNFLMLINDNGVIRPYNEIHGDVFFVGRLGEDFVSLDKRQIQEVLQMFRKREMCIVNKR